MNRNNNLLGGVIGLVSNLLTSVTGLLRTNALDQPVTRSITVTRAGGELRIPETGLQLTIPANAIPGNRLTITVTALPGRTVAYEFEPHGTQFAKPLTFSQDLHGTLFSLLFGKPTLSGGYFKNASQVNTNNGHALINESLNASVSGNRVTFDIWHFSGYMVSTGRSAAPAGPGMESPE